MAAMAGARVASLARNRVSWSSLHLACARIGAIYVPLNWRLSPAEIADLVEDAEPAADRRRRRTGQRAGLEGVALTDLAGRSRSPRRCGRRRSTGIGRR
jgi:fatty-acyl-CoA synthase